MALRSQEQREANEIDLAIFRALYRVESRLPDTWSGRRPWNDGWREAARSLRAARSVVRRYMHEKDRQETA